MSSPILNVVDDPFESLVESTKKTKKESSVSKNWFPYLVLIILASLQRIRHLIYSTPREI